MNRIVFGEEKNFYTLSSNCPSCGVKRGQSHEYGCPLESCPSCHGRLLKCRCVALSIIDSMRITKAIASSLSREEALNILDTEEEIRSTYERQAAFLWTCDNAPPQYREEMERRALEIIGGRKLGNGLIAVPLEKAAECLGLSKEDTEPIMAELETESLYPGWEALSCGRES